jgi:hypothetical protein
VDNAQSVLGSLSTAETFAEALKGLFGSVAAPTGLSSRETAAHNEQLDLAFKLLVTVGGIHRSAFSELQSALRRDDEGLANGILARMNEQLTRSLNLAKWWSQDRHFALTVAVHDYDLVFAIRDRTGSA